jgi:hypothetical protein
MEKKIKYKENKMGEFTTGVSPETLAQKDREITTDKVPTDVEDVFADGQYQRDRLFIFDVPEGEFDQNSEAGRRRMRFKTGSTVQQYLQKTRYTVPFYIRTTRGDGKSYIRRVK